MLLYEDLYAADGTLLLKKGRRITPRIVRRIQMAAHRRPQKRLIIAHTFLYHDFRKALGDPRYTVFFNPPITRRRVLATAERLRIESGLLEELAGMKRRLPYTYRHVLVVAAVSIKVALAFPRGTFKPSVVAHCGFTHDLGKTRIPAGILQKKARLTPHERAVIETHPVAGFLLLNYYLLRDRHACSHATLGHHERSDGSGYPNGIKRISKYARLMSAIDVLDALMTRRPYRTYTYSLRAALDYLVKQSDEGRLDSRVVRVLIRYARRRRPALARMRISRTFREPLPENLSHEKYR